jgi:hypothetical protein
MIENPILNGKEEMGYAFYSDLFIFRYTMQGLPIKNA